MIMTSRSDSNSSSTVSTCDMASSAVQQPCLAVFCGPLWYTFNSLSKQKSAQLIYHASSGKLEQSCLDSQQTSELDNTQSANCTTTSRNNQNTKATRSSSESSCDAPAGHVLVSKLKVLFRSLSTLLNVHASDKLFTEHFQDERYATFDQFWDFLRTKIFTNIVQQTPGSQLEALRKVLNFSWDICSSDFTTAADTDPLSDPQTLYRIWSVLMCCVEDPVTSSTPPEVHVTEVQYLLERVLDCRASAEDAVARVDAEVVEVGACVGVMGRAVAGRTEAEDQLHCLYDEMLEGQLKTGLMVKRGGRIKTWRERWFKLSADSLAYYSSPAEKDRRGVIPLGQVVTFEVLKDKQGTSKPCQFCVRTAQRTYEISALDRRTRAEWVAALNTALQCWKERSLPAVRQSRLRREQMRRRRASRVAELGSAASTPSFLSGVSPMTSSMTSAASSARGSPVSTPGENPLESPFVMATLERHKKHEDERRKQDEKRMQEERERYRADLDVLRSQLTSTQHELQRRVSRGAAEQQRRQQHQQEAEARAAVEAKEGEVAQLRAQMGSLQQQLEQMKIQSAADRLQEKVVLAEQEAAKERLEQLVEEERQAKRDEELVRAAQARVLREEMEAREATEAEMEALREQLEHETGVRQEQWEEKTKLLQLLAASQRQLQLMQRNGKTTALADLALPEELTLRLAGGGTSQRLGSSGESDDSPSSSDDFISDAQRPLSPRHVSQGTKSRLQQLADMYKDEKGPW